MAGRYRPSQAKRIADELVLGNVDTLGRMAGLELGRRLILKSPRRSGRFSQNWNASVDRPDSSTHDVTSEGYALAAGRPIVSGFRLSRQALWWTNGLPYAERLENGYSKQAPAGMIAVTEREMRSVIDRIGARIGRQDVFISPAAQFFQRNSPLFNG